MFVDERGRRGFVDMRSRPPLPRETLLTIGAFSAIPPLSPIRYDSRREVIVDRRGQCFAAPPSEETLQTEQEPHEWAAGKSTKTLFDARDAGWYAELLTRLYPEETREAWLQIISDDL